MERIEFEDALVVEPAKVSILDEMPVGSIVQYGGTNAPAGWLICDGSTISRTEYVDLFNAISTSYGIGDGSTTFNLPNLKGRVAVGLDTNDGDFNELGKTGGEKEHKLTIDEIPSHRHNYKAGIADGNDEGTVRLAQASDFIVKGNYGHSIQNTGGDQPHNILQPYAVINYIIKAVQNTRDFNITDAIVDGGTDLNEVTFNQMQDNMEEAIDGIIETGSDGKGNYHTKFADGTLICRGTTSVVTGIQGNSGSYIDVSFSSSFLNTTYTILTGKTDSGAYWANINVHPSYRTTTGFRMNYFNTANNSTSSGDMYFTYIAIGKWK